MPQQHVNNNEGDNNEGDNDEGDNNKGDNNKGDRHNDEMVTRARAMTRGVGKTRGMTTVVTPPPPPCTMRGMRMTWRGMTGTMMMTTRTATTITMMMT